MQLNVAWGGEGTSHFRRVAQVSGLVYSVAGDVKGLRVYWIGCGRKRWKRKESLSKSCTGPGFSL